MRLILRLLALALIAYAAGGVLLVRENPEAAFWCDLRSHQRDELLHLRTRFPAQPAILFAGGSSTAFSVDPRIITRETGLPSVNLGTSAWSGPKYYIHRSLELARPGDTLVVGTEPNFLVEPDMLEPTQLGVAMAMREGDIDAAAGGDTFGGSVSAYDRARLLRPGSRYLVTWAAKAVSGGPRYHYAMEDVRPGSPLETSRAHPTGKGDPLVHPGVLTPQAREFLEQIAGQCRTREVRLAYALPWYFTGEESAAANREARQRLLDEISRIMPVIQDPWLGVRVEGELFSDTHFHLSPQGSTKRSRMLATGLREMGVNSR